MSAPGGPAPAVCPKCRGTSVTANSKINAHAAHHAVHAVHGVAGLLVAGALWLGAKAMNSATRDWKCGSCNHEFSRTTGACTRCTGKSDKMYHLHCCQTLVCAACSNDLGATDKTTCEMCHKPLVRK